MKCIASCLLAMVVIITAVAQDVDYSLMCRLNVGRDKRLDKPFRAISNSSMYISASEPLVLLGVGLASKNEKLILQGETASIAYAVSSMATLMLKSTVRRPRPFMTHRDIVKLSNGGGLSFPSGHTSSAFSIATTAFMENKQWYIRVPVSVWAVAVGYSRIHLGVHYPSDVVAGALVGMGAAFAGKKINQWLTRSHKVSRKTGSAAADLLRSSS